MNKLRLILALLMCATIGRAQTYKDQQLEVLAANVLGNGLVGGIGSLIHKQAGEKNSHAFVQGFLKGSLGGLVKYNAKVQTYYLAHGLGAALAPLNRLYFFLGHSMVVNAAWHRKLLSNYYCNIYGVDLQFDLQKTTQPKARLSLATLASSLWLASKGFRLDVYRTLEYGQLLFVMDPGQMGIYYGRALFNAVLLQAPGGQPDLSILPHELVHTYQAYDFFGVSSFYSKFSDSLVKKYKWLRLLSNYLVSDYEALFMVAVYLPQFRLPPNYYKNYFEFEAEHFAARQYIPR